MVSSFEQSKVVTFCAVNSHERRKRPESSILDPILILASAGRANLMSIKLEA
jgi:hypothetical protein